MSYVIHSYPQNPNVFKALIAAEYGGLKIEWPQDFKFGVDNKTPEFLKKNPNGQVPTLDTPEGSVWESNAIVRYVARKADKALLGTSDYESAQVDQWIEWGRSRLDSNTWGVVGPIFGFAPFDQTKHDSSKSAVGNALEILNNNLQGKEFVAGSHVTIADIILFTSLLNFFRFAADPEFIKPYTNVVSWYNKLAAIEHFKKVVGEFKWPEKEFAAGSLKF